MASLKRCYLCVFSGSGDLVQPGTCIKSHDEWAMRFGCYESRVKRSESVQPSQKKRQGQLIRLFGFTSPWWSVFIARSPFLCQASLHFQTEICRRLLQRPGVSLSLVVYPFVFYAHHPSFFVWEAAIELIGGQSVSPSYSDLSFSNTEMPPPPPYSQGVSKDKH